ncbi:fused MFS/spermidine synthase [Tengunoibacter tsumagoiensis]|uniref:Major facilitator superfamily (MFS) profile domain-containing protein n=1 Tax=Tengunoibacter tsumagoiensis TaxID=2014871 RepID=A0A401ZTM0_9CHLR|nr:fused MFS/spermidine synthase [Tengunoibacter tsumagoiensis]GCE10213.1 hypothetical protein KTT_00720 [Tengunoibacter tsumagoiensis]
MSTTTSPIAQQEQTLTPDQQPSARWFLILTVFVAGAVSLAIEMAASRLLAPFFGTSLFVWSNIIGLILLYLTVGYYAGGRFSDRFPRPALFYGITIVASLFTSLIPLISDPVLNWSLRTVGTSQPLGIFYGSLVAVILLFAIPNILLGCISPFAIRLRVQQVGSAGRTAGLLYAISTAGSLAGTFLPVLYTMPTFGTTLTFHIFAAALLLISLLGLLVTRTTKQ